MAISSASASSSVLGIGPANSSQKDGVPPKSKGDKMSKPEQQDQRAQGREVSRQYAPQGSLMNRSAYPAALLIPPGDFFRMSPFSLMRRMSEEMDRVLAEFGLNRADAAAAAWAPTIEVSQTNGKYQVGAELPGVN
jgi:hypothetical protein